MRIRLKANLRVFDDAKEKDLLFGPDDALAEAVIDGYERVASGLLQVAAGASEDLPFGDVGDPRLVFLALDGDFDVRFNGSNDAVACRRASSAAGAKARLLIEADVSQVRITNPGAATIRGRWCVAGDPAA